MKTGVLRHGMGGSTTAGVIGLKWVFGSKLRSSVRTMHIKPSIFSSPLSDNFNINCRLVNNVIRGEIT